MNYDIITKSARQAAQSFSKNKQQYNSALETFYNEGRKNPAVAKIIMHNEVINESRTMFIKQKEFSKKIDGLINNAEKVQPQTPLQALSMPQMVMEIKIQGYSANILGHMATHLRAMYLVTDIGKRVSDKVKPLKQEFESLYHQMYPKTGKIREKLTKFNIRMDRVTPKFPKSERKYILEPEKGWANVYPRTASTRIMLIKANKPVKDMNFFDKLKFSKIFKKSGEKQLHEYMYEYELTSLQMQLRP